MRGITLFGLAALALLAALVGGCGGAGAAQPPEIAYGYDVCDKCGMIISDARFAAATLVKGGPTHKFDDIGNMLAYHAEHPDEVVEAWFVHDHGTQLWLRGEGAFYVKSDQIRSPMGHGIAAFADRGAAEAFAASLSARALTFDELRQAPRSAAHGH